MLIIIFKNITGLLLKVMWY